MCLELGTVLTTELELVHDRFEANGALVLGSELKDPVCVLLLV